MAGGLLGGLSSDWLLRRTGNCRLSRQGLAVAGLSLCGALVLASAGITSLEVAVGIITLGAFAAASAATPSPSSSAARVSPRSSRS
jgi:hypothetical protein